MHGTGLGRARRSLVPRMLLAVALVLGFTAFSATVTPQGASALAIPPPVTWMPAPIVGTGVVAVEGAALATAGATVVAGAAVFTGGVLAGYKAADVVWGWVSGHNGNTYANSLTNGTVTAINSAFSFTTFPVARTFAGPPSGYQSFIAKATSAWTDADINVTWWCDGHVGQLGSPPTGNYYGGSASIVSFSSTTGSGGSLVTTWSIPQGYPINFGCNVPSGTLTRVDLHDGPVVGTGSADPTTPLLRWEAYTGTYAPHTITVTPTSSCKNSAGTVTTVAGSPISFMSDTATASLPVITAPACPSNTLRTALTTPVTSAGQSFGNLFTWTAPTVSSTYLNCQPGGSAAPCQVTLTKTNPAGQVINCTATGLCLDYTGSNPAADGSTYTCKWGPYTIAVGDCINVVLNPDLSAGTGTGTSGSTFPSTGTNTDPTTGSASTGTGNPAADAADTGGKNCMGAAWSWNPVNWVYIPVKCALTWAFVPPAGSFQTAFATAQAGWNATGIPAWGSALGGIATGLGNMGTDSGCAGPHFSIPLGGNSYDFDPLDACDEPMETVAVVIKLFLTIAVVVFGARFAARPLVAAFGMNGAV